MFTNVPWFILAQEYLVTLILTMGAFIVDYIKAYTHQNQCMLKQRLDLYAENHVIFSPRDIQQNLRPSELVKKNHLICLYIVIEDQL